MVSKKLHLHLDADTSSKALHNALIERGHDVTRTPTEWMPLDASDEQQLLGATAQGRAEKLLFIAGVEGHALCRCTGHIVSTLQQGIVQGLA